MTAALEFIVTARPFLNAWIRSVRISLCWVGVSHAIHCTRMLVSWSSAISLSVKQEPLVGLHGLLLHIIKKPLPRLALARHHQLRSVMALSHSWLLMLCSLSSHVLRCFRWPLPPTLDTKLLTSSCTWLFWVVECLVFLENFVFRNKNTIGARCSHVHGRNVTNVISDKTCRFAGRTSFALFLF